MQKGNSIWWTILGIAVIGGAIFLFTRGPINTTDNDLRNARSEYENSQFGFSFEIPDGYIVSETRPRPGELMVMLLPENYEPPQGGEGPASVSVHALPRGESGDISSFVRANPVSNWNLATSPMSETIVDGAQGVTYSHDGLYPARATAFIHRGNAVFIIGQYMDRGDKVYSDYEGVVRSFELE